MKLDEALKEIMAQEGLNITRLAQEVGIPRKTMSSLLSGNNKKARLSTHTKLTARFGDKIPPLEAGRTNTDPIIPKAEDISAGPIVSQIKRLVRPSSKPANDTGKQTDEMDLKLRIFRSRELIRSLRDYLEWFLAAGPRERESFRTSLGPDFEWFSSLIRAMRNEKALEVVTREGELNSEKKPKG